MIQTSAGLKPEKIEKHVLYTVGTSPYTTPPHYALHSLTIRSIETHHIVLDLPALHSFTLYRLTKHRSASHRLAFILQLHCSCITVELQMCCIAM